MEETKKIIPWFKVECVICKDQGKTQKEYTFNGRSSKEADKNLQHHYMFKHQKRSKNE